MYVGIFQRAKAISGGSYCFAAGSRQQTRDQRPETKPSQARQIMRHVAQSLNFRFRRCPLPLPFLWAKTAGDSVLLLLLLLLGEGRATKRGGGLGGTEKLAQLLSR